MHYYNIYFFCPCGCNIGSVQCLIPNVPFCFTKCDLFASKKLHVGSLLEDTVQSVQGHCRPPHTDSRQKLLFKPHATYFFLKEFFLRTFFFLLSLKVQWVTAGCLFIPVSLNELPHLYFSDHRCTISTPHSDGWWVNSGQHTIRSFTEQSFLQLRL